MAQAPRTKIPIRVPAVVALALLAAMAACIAYIWPVLLTRVIRRKLRGPALYALSLTFAVATIGFAVYCGIDLLPATDHRVVYRAPFGSTTLYIVPALLAWGASALAWAGVGALGSCVALAGAAAWGLKPMYATWTSNSDFWTSENPYFYGAGAALVAVAIILVVAQVVTIRDSRAAMPARA